MTFGMSYYVFDTETWEVITRVSSGVIHTAISPDGTKIGYVSGTYNEAIVRPIDTGPVVSLWRDVIQNMPMSTAFSPDGMYFAVGDVRGNIQTWEIATRQRTSAIRGQGFSTSTRVNAITYSPDGRVLVTAESSPQGIIRVYDAASLQLVNTYGADMGTQGAYEAVFSPDGSLLATLIDNQLILLETTNYSEVAILYWLPAAG